MPRRRAAAAAAAGRDSPRSVQQERNEAEEAYYQTYGDYKHGSIVRIKLKNFLTYESVEVFPKPRLNMVCGPNGTGKSSILCAVCLGLGGEPRLLGRASHVGTFVQTNKEKATIELELANENGENSIITRTINKDDDDDKKDKSKSVFTWDGDTISGKKVREKATREYQIQIDNLCTFLPQEKVGGFSGMTPENLLRETEKTLSADKKLHSDHMQLIELQAELLGGEDQVDSLRSRLQQLNVELKRMEREVERMNELKKDQEMEDLLKKKIMWMRFDRARDLAVELKAEKDALMGPFQEARNDLGPLEQALNDAKARMAQAAADYQAFESEVTTHKNEMDREKAKYEKHDDKIEEILGELNSLENHRATLEDKADQQRDKVTKLEEAIETQPALEDLNAEKDRLVGEFNALTPEKARLKDQKDEAEARKNEVEEEVNNLERRLKNLTDEKKNRERNFYATNDDTQRAYKWVHAHRADFRKEVFGPIACEVNPKSNNAAAYLEQHVANNVLRSFVVQDKKDYDFLYQEVRVKQNIPVNITLVEGKPQAKPRLYSDKKLEMLRREHGVIGYLDESFEAPDVVMEALRNSSSIHKVLVGSDQTQVSMDDRNLAEILSQPEQQGGRIQGYSVFTTQHNKSYKYQAAVSNYSGKLNMRVDDVKPAKWLKMGGSEELKVAAQTDLQNMNAEFEGLQAAFKEAKEAYDSIVERQQEANSNVREVRGQISGIQKLTSKLRTARRKLEDLENELAVDDDTEKTQKIVFLNQRIAGSLKALRNHAQSYQKMLAATISSSGARLLKEATINETRQCKEQYDDRFREVQHLENEIKAAKDKYVRKKAEARALQNEAEEAAPLQDEKGNDTELKALLQAEDGLGRFDSVDNAEATLEEVQQRIRGVHEDTNVFRNFEQKQAQAERTQQQLDELTTGKEAKRRDMMSIAEPWEKSLEKMLSKVDKRFSKYMGELRCVGEVSLRKGSNKSQEEEALFADYAVEIKVSFREGVAPTVLSAQVQSGGERAVSTIMYLMAMQDMMVAPFRCVDEINQGLDERNERLVFKRIVENSTKPPGPGGPTDHCGQYWLITPKLLPNLTDMEEEAVNVLCIYNGAYNLKRPRDWDVEELLNLRKRPRLEEGTDE